MRLDGTSTRVPVLGLRPTRGCRCRVRKLPKPRISILSACRSERTMLSKIASTITSDSLRVISTTRETSSIRSAFVIFPSFQRLPQNALSSNTITRRRLFLRGPGFTRQQTLQPGPRRGSPTPVILQPIMLLRIGHGLQAEPDFPLFLIHPNHFEIRFL